MAERAEQERAEAGCRSERAKQNLYRSRRLQPRSRASQATPARTPLTYTPPYLAEKILTSRSALEGERKQVTVLFADLKGNTELIRDLEEA